jgi:hypothetical protein
MVGDSPEKGKFLARLILKLPAPVILSGAVAKSKDQFRLSAHHPN